MGTPPVIKVLKKEAAIGRHIPHVTARNSLCQLFLPNLQDALTGCFYIITGIFL